MKLITSQSFSRWPFIPGSLKFRRLWAAESVSSMGSQVSLIAIPLVAILLLKSGSVEVGLLMAAGRAPYLLFGLLAGVLVDRWNHRVVLIVSDWIRAVALALIPALWWLDKLSVTPMYLIVFLVGVGTVFFDVAYQSLLTSVVDPPNLMTANQLLEGSSVASKIAGPGLAAFLLKVVSAPYAILIDAVSFALSALCLHSMGKVQPISEARTETASLRKEFVGGISFIKDTPFLRWIALIAGTSNLLLQGLQAVFFVFLSQELKLSGSAIAGVVLVGSIGGIIGLAAVGRLTSRLGVGRAVLLATITTAIGGIVLAFARGSSTSGAIIVGSAYLLLNASDPLFDINVITIRQTITPQPLMSRTTAAIRTIIWGALPLGSLMGGVMGAALGTRTTIAVLGGALLIPALFTVLSPIRAIDRISDLDIPVFQGADVENGELESEVTSSEEKLTNNSEFLVRNP
jgi:Na+/melibiose symporter-like transporter